MTTGKLDTSAIPNRIWYVTNSDGSIDSAWASRSLARSRKRMLINRGDTGITISSSSVIIASSVPDNHS